MNSYRLLARSLVYHWRLNLAVIAAVAAGTAVISGALIVGDSVRGSLRQMTLDRLGRIDFVMGPGRFFREDLSRRVWARPGFANRFPATAPGLVMPGTFATGLAPEDQPGGARATAISRRAPATARTRRAGGVLVVGTDDRLWGLLDSGGLPVPTGDEVLINRRLADQLNVKPGDDVSLLMQIPSAIPRESLLGKRDGDFREIPFKVRAVLEENIGASRFSLVPNQQLPSNAFVSLATLQQSLGLAELPPSRRNPEGVPARVNTMFATARSPVDQAGLKSGDAAQALSLDVAATVSLSDLGLRIVGDPLGYTSLESEQQILGEVYAHVMLGSARRRKLAASPVFAYLANELIDTTSTSRTGSKKLSAYSVVAGLDPVAVTTPPFGPFVWASAAPSHPLAENEIVLNEWVAEDLAAKVGDEVRLRYHTVGSHGELPEEERAFRVAGIVKLAGPAADPGLVPDVKGITDAKSIQDWDQPFPMKLNLVTKRDEAYWDKFHATPKSFIPLPTAKKLFGSRFGSLTSVRIAARPNQSLGAAVAETGRELLRSMDPRIIHMEFQAVKYNGLRAAAGSNDFSELFLGFSFFLIAAAAILIGLVFRLGIERRGRSVGLLGAVGFTPRRLRAIFLLEGLALVGVGALLGTAAAVGYAELMVYGLKHWWNDAIGTQFLDVYIVPATLAIGFGASAVVSALAVLWGLRQLHVLSPRDLLSGATEPQISTLTQRRRAARSLWIGGILAASAALILACGMTGAFGVLHKLNEKEAFEGLSWNVVLFFVEGFVLLIAGVLLLSGLLDIDRSAAVRGRGAAGMARLGLRNTARHRQRSVASVSLIAAATFVIVAVAAGRRNPTTEKPERNSGNGGFRLVGESTEPILPDMNTTAGQKQLDLHVDPNTTYTSLLTPLLHAAHVVSFRVKQGEDASCLNVYQTRLPTILGAPKEMIERGGFRFIGSREPNPWTLLEASDLDGSIPVFGDANTLQYSLHKGVGASISVPDDLHPQHQLKIAGMLDGSVFQGVLLMSEDNFCRLFPQVQGYRYFLIDVPGLPGNANKFAEFLDRRLTPYGFYAEPVSERLADFLAVQNTYLSTFQTLGGFGLLLGTLGLATVMIRNVFERRGELALLRALGFEQQGLAWMVLVETAVLLLCGLAIGTVAALVAMAPHLLSIGADVDWKWLAVILLAVFCVSMLASLAASIAAARTPILGSLQSE